MYDGPSSVLVDYDPEYETPAIASLLEFISSFEYQICSVTLRLDWPNESILERLLEGTFGQARILKVISNPDFSSLDVLREYQHSSFTRLESLHFQNAAPPWLNWGLSNLTELRLEDKGWTKPIFECHSVISRCPSLERLVVKGFKCPSLDDVAITPVLLNKLKILEIEPGTISGLDTLLASIQPEDGSLHVIVSLGDYGDGLKNFMDVLRQFIDRSRATTLQFISRKGPHFASSIGVLPHIQTLVLEGFYFSDLAPCREYPGDPAYYFNPAPVTTKLRLWLHVRCLCLRRCTLQVQHASHLVSSPPTSAIYLNSCYKQNYDGRSLPFDTKVTKEDTDALSRLVPLAHIVTDESKEWVDVMLALKGRFINHD
ncbi:hypothetical protein RhiJN_25151 [Ceratobasidium sp. AG-Ba]|nr:hypothetical protein RhiJN_25151 [Ceratobasidium sp. AG-Ba]